MTCTAVIVTYHNSAKELAACLTSCRTNNITELIVIDNGDDPRLKKVATAHQAQYQADASNPGFATSAHRGALKTTNDVLLFLNPDAALGPKAAVQGSTYLAKHQEVAVVGLALTSSLGALETMSFGNTVSITTLITRHLTTTPVPTVPTAVDWVSGGALMIWRDVYRMIGGFDPRYFMYWEDVDICRRVKAAGKHIVFLPAARVAHQKGASLSTTSNKTKMYDQSADKYFHKHYSKPVWYLQRSLRSLYRSISPPVH